VSDEAQTDDWLTGTPMDPAAVPPEPLPPLAGFPFLHRGAGAVIVGPTGGGRSALVQACLYDAGLTGLSCAYLGSEVTPGEFNARAAVLAQRRGDTMDDETRQRLGHIRYLELGSVITKAWRLEASRDSTRDFVARMNSASGEQPVASESHAPWADLIADRYQVVAIDPLSAVASALDLDFDKSNAEFIRFYDRLIQPLTRRGVTVILVDNVGHAEEAKSRAKGASAKSDRADLTFACSTATNPPGLAIKAVKVRSVRAGFQRGDEWLFLKDNQRIIRRGHSTEADRPTFRPTTIMQRVSEAVEHDAGLTRNSIRAAVGGRAEYVTLALELLISEGFIDAEKDGQALHHRSAKPYRSATESTKSQPGPNQVPDPVPGTKSPESLPLKGGHGTGPGHNGNSNNHNQVPADEALHQATTKFPELSV
jgi:hypothetical protein